MSGSKNEHNFYISPTRSFLLLEFLFTELLMQETSYCIFPLISEHMQVLSSFLRTYVSVATKQQLFHNVYMHYVQYISHEKMENDLKGNSVSNLPTLITGVVSCDLK